MERRFRVHDKVLKDLRNYIFVFAIFGALMGLGLVVYGVSVRFATFSIVCDDFILQSQSSLQEKYLHVVGLGTTYILTFIHTIWVGQACENVVRKFKTEIRCSCCLRIVLDVANV